ncbi:hypothetical protein MNBD_NITROSPINAE02-1782 [hydrothermal vent metagenome]|uniref:Glycosyl transferase family 1 domain-containing protein n=1 Tax=hydrothermal vent metagenome TaxID=652676 RepID=A0A3B1C0M4_9ZZZZ
MAKKIQYQGRTLRVCVVGGDKDGWALDVEAKLARLNLARFCDVVEEESEADVIHSVWPNNTTSRWLERGKPKIGSYVLSFPNDPLRMVELSGLYMFMKSASAIIAQSSQALRGVKALGLKKCHLVPYPYEDEGYRLLEKDDPRLLELRKELDIEPGDYVISNFFRDTEGSDLKSPKRQKAPEVFVAIVKKLASRVSSRRIVVLLTGPRRHWLRGKLKESEIEYRYYGETVSEDDYPKNIQSKETLNLLYQLSDIHLITSRWEGAPRALFECAQTDTPVVSSRAGIAEDVLPESLLFDNPMDCVEILKKDIEEGYARRFLGEAKRRLEEFSNDEVVGKALQKVYAGVVEDFGKTEGLEPEKKHASLYPSGSGTGLVVFSRRVGRFLARKAFKAFERKPGERVVTIWNRFMPPPWGGANQFLLALEKEFQRQGVRTMRNDYKRTPTAHIFNSMSFEYSQIEIWRRQFPDSVFIHRIDGPMSRYRETDPSKNDDIIFSINRFMDYTVFQSIYSMTSCLQMGYSPKNPSIIRNAVDPSIFNSIGKKPFDGNRPVRVVSSSWSDNVRKGKDTFTWLDDNLDFAKVEYTFVGKCKAEFKNIKSTGPVPSDKVAEQLRNADVYIFASAHESAPNAVTEAMACGLPVLYLDSGGTKEIVGMGGIGWKNVEEIPELLETVRNNYEVYNNGLSVPGIGEIADSYLKIVKSQPV